jgi:SCY1-like protein 1
MSSIPGSERPTSAPPPLGGASTLSTPSLSFVPTAISASNSTVSSPTTARPSNTGKGFGTPSKAKGMQLGASKIPTSVAAASLAAQLEEEAAAEDGIDGNPWGTDDLIDVNADEGDWSELW